MNRQRTTRWLWGLVLAGVTCILTTATTHALIVVTPNPQHPVVNPVALRMTGQTVTVKLSDRAAEVSVECTYHNSSNRVLEGTYLFPLPPEAAVDKFSLFVDGEEILAELLDADAARREYNQIVRRTKDPALLEYAGRQLLKARIFPINANDDATIKLYYTHPLTADFGTTDFVFPFSVEPHSGNAKLQLTAEIVTTSPLRAVTSPTHEIDVDYNGPQYATVTATPSAASVTGAENDFHLLCTYDARDLGAQFLTTIDDEGQRFFMGIIAPGEATEGAILPKDVVFCFDRSGSMQGEKIEQARAALRFCLSKLNADDRFGLIVFNDAIDAYEQSLRPADRANIRAARAFVDRVDADGGTFIDGALQQAFGMFTEGDRPRYLVFLTDGRPTVGTRDEAAILRNAAANNTAAARLFSFGVGYDLNAGLLNDLADAGQGLASYVEPGQDVEVKVSNFFRKISRPVMTDCQLVFNGIAHPYDVYPRQLPDLYAGSEIIVVGRFDTDGDLVAKLIGSRGTENLNHTFETTFAPKRDQYAFIPKLWGGRRIGNLLEGMRKNGETPEVKDEVVRLSKKYGIMTPYTAFLAAPEEVRITTMRNTPRHGSNIRGGRASDLLYGAQQNPQAPSVALPKDQEDARKSIDAAGLKGAGNLQSLSSIGLPRPDARVATEDRTGTLTIAGRQFTSMQGVWTDWNLMDSTLVPADTIAIKPYSDAYFRLARVPEIARILSVGDSLIFLWRNIVIRIDETGAETWNPAWEKPL